MKHFACTLTIVAALSHTAVQAEDIGTIVTPSGDPIAGLPVVISKVGAPDDSFVSLTDQSGTIIVTGIPDGEYEVAPINGLGPASKFSVTSTKRCLLFQSVCATTSTQVTDVGDIQVPENWEMNAPMMR